MDNNDSQEIISTMTCLQDAYAVQLSENNNCIKKLLGDIQSLQNELRAERKKVDLLENELLNTFGFRWFNSFVKVTLERDALPKEWDKFLHEYINGFEFSKTVYKWVETKLV